MLIHPELFYIVWHEETLQVSELFSSHGQIIVIVSYGTQIQQIYKGNLQVSIIVHSTTRNY